METEVRHDALSVGEKLHVYVIESILGSGAFGITYRVRHSHFDSLHVIKEYFPESGVRDRGTQRITVRSQSEKEIFTWGLDSFFKEAKLLHNLSHPNIVKVSDFFESNDTAYFVMPWIEGNTLHSWMQVNPRPSQKELESIFIPLLEGLKYIHERGLLHRDIKPENILLTSKGMPILIDFGAARDAIGMKSRVLTQVLTPHFAPIEQYGSKGNFTASLDLYSLSVCLYQCITGDLPDVATDRMLEDSLSPLGGSAYESDYTSAFLSGIDKGLALRAEERHPDASSMQKALWGMEEGRGERKEKRDEAKREDRISVKEKNHSAMALPRAEPPFSVRTLAFSILPFLLIFIGLGLGAGLAYVGYQEYLEKRSRETADAEEWRLASEKNTIKEYEGYLEGCVACMYREEAISRVASLHGEAKKREAEKRRKAEEKRRAEELKASIGSLRVDVEPVSAKIRILNIVPVFSQGMALKAGRYHVEVSAPGYETRKEWVKLDSGEDRTLTVRLVDLPPIREKITNSMGMTFLRIPAGEFWMGSPENEDGRDDDEKRHRVKISKDFYMMSTEVTQAQWERVMEKNPPSFTSCGKDCPVERVSWNEVQEFIKKLNTMDKSLTVRLPTEAEWEYAARAGTDTPFAFGSCLSTSDANYDGNYPLSTCPKESYRQRLVEVAFFKPNAWGLYDMHGNVWEWVQDVYKEEYETLPGTDPIYAGYGDYRVFRGGGWNGLARNCRSADRSRSGADLYSNGLGFRLAGS